MSKQHRRLRLLLLTPQLPYPPFQGTSLRNFYILRGLAQRHEIHLLSYQEEPDNVMATGAGPLPELCASVETAPVKRRTFLQRLWRLLADERPDMAHRLHSSIFDLKLRQTLSNERLDLVQIEGIELASAIPLIRRLSPGCKIVFDDHNAEAELQYRAFLTDLREPLRWPAALYSLVQTRRLRRYERWVCEAADGVSVVSESDRRHLQTLAPDLDPYVVPNCIDVDSYASAGEGTAAQYDLVFIGKMDYRPNVDAVLWFARESWPRIRRERPGSTWAIVGQKPHRRLDGLRELTGITITGRVPRIEPYLEGGRVCIMPFRIGSGTRLKLLQALAAGKAVVSTSRGAEGYPVVNEKHLLLADDPRHFAEAVLRLLDDTARRSRLGTAGQAFARGYDWRNVIPTFEQLYARIGLL